MQDFNTACPLSGNEERVPEMPLEFLADTPWSGLAFSM